MAKEQSQAPETEGIKIGIKIDDGSVVSMGHIINIGNIEDSSRETKKYKPLNNTEYEEIVGTGSETYAPLSASILYNPSDDEGINYARGKYKDNEEVEIVIELNNAATPTGKGTTFTQKGKLSKFSTTAEEEGRLKADIELQRLGDVAVTKAS